MKNIYCLFFCLAWTLVSAQETAKNTWIWGFSAGLETQTLGIETLDGKEPDETAVLSERNRIGGTIGMVGQKKIWRGLSFQTGLSLSSNHNQVTFRPGGQSRFQFLDLELPVYCVFANQKNGDLPLRGKVMFGPRLGWNLTSNDNDRLQFLQERFALDLGLGVDINMGKWRLCPEAIYSHGLNNLHDFTGKTFDLLVGRAVRDKLAFRLLLMRAK